MRAFLQLTRPINLLIIAFTMVVMREAVIGGAVPALHMPLGLFLLLIGSTVLIAAGGNVINDYFDTRIDRINKPGAVIVGRKVKRRVAITGHIVLSAAGLLLGAYTAWRSQMPLLALIPAFAIGALWSYSTTFKRRLFIGNGLVATLTALVPLTVGLYELGLQARAGASSTELANAWSWILAYTAFAFLGTLVRELQKDMADVQGDAAEGCRTVPIVFGMAWSRGLVVAHTLLMIAAGYLIYPSLLEAKRDLAYVGVAVVLPLLLGALLTLKARDREGHLRAGNLMKLAMVTAIAYALLHRFA